ncbi:MAG TPA: hypothetical protein VFP33_13985 [Gallionella sp.]|nr:hypothetical protein [Gallionella sp.]
MRLIAKNMAFYALAFPVLIFCIRAEACSREERAKDIRQSLPAAIEHAIPNTTGVEVVASHMIQKTGTKLIAAILSPNWHFISCDDSEAPDSDDGVRTLVVWRHTSSGWLEIGRNSDIIYVIKTAGLAVVSLSWHGGKLSVEQYSNPPPRASFSDDYDFVYDATVNKIRLAHRKSSALYNTMCCGGGTEADEVEYEAAEKKYGADACDHEGFEGDIDYISGKASIVQCEFAHKQASNTLTINSSPIYLDTMKNIRFVDLDAIEPLTLRSSGTRQRPSVPR